MQVRFRRARFLILRQYLNILQYRNRRSCLSKRAEALAGGCSGYGSIQTIGRIVDARGWCSYWPGGNRSEAINVMATLSILRGVTTIRPHINREVEFMCSCESLIDRRSSSKRPDLTFHISRMSALCARFSYIRPSLDSK